MINRLTPQALMILELLYRWRQLTARQLTALSSINSETQTHSILNGLLRKKAVGYSVNALIKTRIYKLLQKGFNVLETSREFSKSKFYPLSVNLHKQKMIDFLVANKVKNNEYLTEYEIDANASEILIRHRPDLQLLKAGDYDTGGGIKFKVNDPDKTFIEFERSIKKVKRIKGVQNGYDNIFSFYRLNGYKVVYLCTPPVYQRFVNLVNRHFKGWKKYMEIYKLQIETPPNYKAKQKAKKEKRTDGTKTE